MHFRLPGHLRSDIQELRMFCRLSRIAVATLILVPAMALADGPKFTSTWKAPEASTTSFAGKKVAALIISDDQDLRVAGEEALVRELAALGLGQGVATWRMIPREELRDPQKAKGWYERAAVEGIVSMRLVSAETRQTWTPSMWVSASYSTLWGYYPYGWGSVYAIGTGHTRKETLAVIETLVFSVPANKLLWAGVTETMNPKDAGTVIADVVKATIKEMTKQGLLRARKGK
jgi:hypothetical protein